jgi:hypothetical protein
MCCTSRFLEKGRFFGNSVMQVTENWELKVADFNMSKFMEEAGSAPASVDANILNPRWLAPEVLGGQRPTLASVRADLS